MATVGQLMTRDVTFIHEEASIQDAARSMHSKRIGSLLVKKEDDFCGYCDRNRCCAGGSRTTCQGWSVNREGVNV